MSIIALLIHGPTSEKVRQWWDLLESETGLRGVRRVPFPHITLCGCDGIEAPRIQEVLDHFADRTRPVMLRTVGLGVFLEPEPVAYAPVIRTPDLSELHQQLWESVASLGGHMFDLYNPQKWIPHITLAQFDLVRERLPEVMKILLSMELTLEFEVRNLTLFDWIGPRYEPRERYPLMGGVRL